MVEAPRKRPAKHSVLATFSAHLLARPQAVFEALDSRFAPAQPSPVAYLADARAFFIVMEGSWWYRAEYRIVPDDDGSHLEHSVVNVAQRAERLALLAASRVIRTAPLEFHALVRSLRAELH